MLGAAVVPAGSDDRREATSQPASQPVARPVGIAVVQVQRVKDRVTVTRYGRAAVVTVHSSMGIGWVVLECPGAKWPVVIRVQFIYTDGRDFKRLEGFAAVLSGGKPLREQKLTDGKYKPSKVVRDLAIPAGTKLTRLKTSWVDAYR